HHPVGSAPAGEISLLKCPHLDRRIHQKIVIPSRQAGSWLRLGRHDLPAGGHILELDLAFLRTSTVRIQQNLGEIEKGMLWIEFRPVRARVIYEHLIFNARTLPGSSHSPAALVHWRQAD